MTETQHGASSEIMPAISAATTDPPKNMVHPNPTPKDFSYYDTSYYMASEQKTMNETDPTPAALQTPIRVAEPGFGSPLSPGRSGRC